MFDNDGEENCGRGADDERGTSTHQRPNNVRRAADLVRKEVWAGIRCRGAIPIKHGRGSRSRTTRIRRIHHMTQMFDLPVHSERLRFGMDFLGPHELPPRRRHKTQH